MGGGKKGDKGEVNSTGYTRTANEIRISYLKSSSFVLRKFKIGANAAGSLSINICKQTITFIHFAYMSYDWTLWCTCMHTCLAHTQELELGHGLRQKLKPSAYAAKMLAQLVASFPLLMDVT